MQGLTGYQRATLELVMAHDSGNPITGKQIAEAIGLKARKSGKEGADLRSIIRALRCKEYPVCASGKGYWWPQTQQELSTYIASFDARILDQARAVAGMKMGFDKVDKAVATAKVQSTQVLYYEVCNEAKERKVYQVMGDRSTEFLAKFPSARLISSK